MTARKKAKEDSSKWSQRVLKRQRQKDQFTKQYTKINVKQKMRTESLQQRKENMLNKLKVVGENKVNNINDGKNWTSNDINVKVSVSDGNFKCDGIETCQKKSLLKKLSNKFFSPVWYLLNFTVAKVSICLLSPAKYYC